MKPNARNHRLALAGCLLAALTAGAVEQAMRTEADLVRLAGYSAATARLAGRAACPPAFSADPGRDAELQSGFARLLEAGAPRVAEMYAVDEQAVRDVLGDARPRARRLVPRLHQDLESGRFLAGPELESAADGLSAGAWFFYNNYFAAYAGMNPGFRRADAPLARGAAALAALGNTRRGNLALLPAWLPEAALAALVFNADQELPDMLVSASPADEALQARLTAALAQAGLASSPAKVALALGAPVLEISTASFELRRLLPDDPAARDQLWRFALQNIAHPALLAEIGTALWMRRAPDAQTVGALDEIAGRMLAAVEQDLQARGVALTNASRQAVFDTAALPAIFGFIWTYRPEFAAWRKAALDAAALPDAAARNARLRGLEKQLAGMLAPGAADAVPPAARLCALLAAAPAGAAQPQIALTYSLRSPAAPAADGQAAAPPKMAVSLTLTWQVVRQLPWGDDAEEIVFAGAAGEMLPSEEAGELEKIRVAFVRPGLETGQRRLEAEVVQFSDAERRRLEDSLRRVRRGWAGVRWRAAQVRDAARFRRLMVLYYARGESGEEDPANFAAACLRMEGRADAPAWAAAAFQHWEDARAALLEQGNPDMLYEWASRYMFLLALAFETGNPDCGDALLQDFLGMTLALALGDLPEQPDRPRFFADPRWHLAEAWHWSRDVVSIVRDGGDGRQAWVRPGPGWDDLFRGALPALAGAGGAAAFYRPADGQVELGACWMQLRKLRQRAAAPPAADELAAEVAALAAIAAGADEYRFSYLLAAPTQNPAETFALAPFGAAGPYAGESGLRAVLGIRSGIRE